MDWVMTVVGLVILLLAGDALVKGAVNFSLRLGIPALIVSLTIVAFGTSAPELLIAISAVIEDAPGIAIGNVVGSNTANILLVLGVPAIISGLHMNGIDTRKTYVFMLIGSAIFAAACFLGPITWIHGLILLGTVTLILADAMIEARNHQQIARNGDAAEMVEGADFGMSGKRIALFMGLGLVGLPLGAELLVNGSVQIARHYGVSETVIGLTLVAVGTSLPELATTVVAAFRRSADVAIGNVIGSNMFNALAIVGVASLVGPIPVGGEILGFDIWVMLGASLLLGPFVFLGWNISRRSGVILTGLYLAYVIAVLT